MKKEYEYYGDVLTTQESADIGGLIIKFEFLGATYQELKHKLR